MREALENLFLRTWWIYDRDFHLPYSAAYHWFNILEGVAWLVFALLVVMRHWRYRRSQIEWLYAFAFVTFALSDFREAWIQQSWLIWFKIGNIVALYWLRKWIIRDHYPDSKVY